MTGRVESMEHLIGGNLNHETPAFSLEAGNQSIAGEYDYNHKMQAITLNLKEAENCCFGVFVLYFAIYVTEKRC